MKFNNIEEKLLVIKTLFTGSWFAIERPVNGQPFIITTYEDLHDYVAPILVQGADFSYSYSHEGYCLDEERYWTSKVSMTIGSRRVHLERDYTLYARVEPRWSENPKRQMEMILFATALREFYPILTRVYLGSEIRSPMSKYPENKMVSRREPESESPVAAKEKDPSSSLPASEEVKREAVKDVNAYTFEIRSNEGTLTYLNKNNDAVKSLPQAAAVGYPAEVIAFLKDDPNNFVLVQSSEPMPGYILCLENTTIDYLPVGWGHVERKVFGKKPRRARRSKAEIAAEKAAMATEEPQQQNRVEATLAKKVDELTQVPASEKCHDAGVAGWDSVLSEDGDVQVPLLDQVVHKHWQNIGVKSAETLRSALTADLERRGFTEDQKTAILCKLLECEKLTGAIYNEVVRK